MPLTVWRASSYRPVFDTLYNYKLVNAANGKAIDISGSSTADGAKVVQATFDGRPSQLFQIVVVSSSVWKLVNVKSDKVIIGSGSASGADAKQYTYAGTDDQGWSIDDHNGHFKIVNKSSKNALEVDSGKTSDGAAIQTSPWAGTLIQDWDIRAVE